ncbi:hypothetical protein SCHPADRAFT_910743 [Schizopora paradoxa]|uniref:Uncharacterized protein n=1 Tax=Schizopora paradoxa TaxID=27342 RepID=A0A0H2R3E2_9AGAM|nr:hypothetical protein SCHPADRAFT_910743 [Schizopora paradoxa]
MNFKGKSTSRSWTQLPPDVIRLVVTQLLLDVSATAFLPQTWQHREHWLSRMVYNIVRETEAVEQVMMVCPAWMNAIEYHLYWQHATAVFDPNDMHLSFYRQQVRVSPYKHFRYNLLARCCVPCRINQPSMASGLYMCKRQVYTYALGHVPACKDHKKDTFCGICLRDCTNDENAVVENEDFDCWPQVESTCRLCRMEWLVRAAKDGESQGNGKPTKEFEAIGGKQLAPQDWEARQAVDAFVEMGEGTVREVISLCMEKLWLRKHTKIAEMMSLAVATSKLQNRTTGRNNGFRRLSMGAEQYESEEEMSEADDEDDPDLMSMTEDRGGVRDLAINDWARTRILEGHWLSPADQWYALQGQAPPEWGHPPYINATHPCPWNYPASEADQPHPPLTMAFSSPPPTLPLCSSAFEAYKRQMRSLLYPAMVNIVRRIVMESAMDGTDACVRVAKMEVEDIAKALRVSGVWYNGTDWMRDRDESYKHSEGDDSSVSSKSSSEATSPVLSTSTLQTTPSPPPPTEHKKEESDDVSMPPPHVVPSQGTTRPKALPIAISPVLESPTQIPSIPYIPDSVERYPQFTIDTFKTTWRDACAPLFQCKCSICERAVQLANLEAGTVVPSQEYDEDERVAELLQRPIQVEILPATEEEEEEFMLSPNVSDLIDCSEPEDEGREESVVGRKRSVDAVEDDLDDIELDPADIPRLGRCTTPSTPPKRQRLDESFEPVIPTKQHTIPEAIRLQKRGSEELDEISSAQDSDLTLGDPRGKTAATRKRVKTDSSAGTSPSPRPPLTSSESESMSDDGDAIGGSDQGRVSLDDSRLLVMDDEDSMEVSSR